jgi:hypothetical protein
MFLAAAYYDGEQPSQFSSELFSRLFAFANSTQNRCVHPIRAFTSLYRSFSHYNLKPLLSPQGTPKRLDHDRNC